jgi:hypothetical protein
MPLPPMIIVSFLFSSAFPTMSSTVPEWSSKLTYSDSFLQIMPQQGDREEPINS